MKPLSSFYERHKKFVLPQCYVIITFFCFGNPHFQYFYFCQNINTHGNKYNA